MLQAIIIAQKIKLHGRKMKDKCWKKKITFGTITKVTNEGFFQGRSIKSAFSPRMNPRWNYPLVWAGLSLKASQQQVSDSRNILTVFILSKRRDQLQHLLFWRDICLGEHPHHIRHTAKIKGSVREHLLLERDSSKFTVYSCLCNVCKNYNTQLKKNI